MPTGAVFLSYASEDSAAAERICASLRASGIEVWFDQSELRGGDAWDAAIREQIKGCALFMPLISRNAHARAEGYFRLEWKLAVDRSHLIAPDQAFLLPVVIDDTPQADKRIPDRFRELQWSRLPAGDTTPVFVERVLRLLSPERAHVETVPGHATSASSAAAPSRSGASERSRSAFLLIATVAVAVLLFIAGSLLWFYAGSRHGAEKVSTPTTAAAPVALPVFAPPPHSIAVLPFVNMSGDSQQDYFSDGLSEELLNSLSRITALQVAARTSSFSFKGKQVDIADIAHKLNVGAILEGSVRKAGTQVRITAQLINTVTGFHLWSQTYDRDLSDILALQTEIATAVTAALQAKLLANSAALIELGGTQNPRAFDAYLRGQKLSRTELGKESFVAELAAFSEAIRLDPGYAKAYVEKAVALNDFASIYAGPAMRGSYGEARAASEKAVALAPELGEAHMALAAVLVDGFLEYARAVVEYDRALALSPNDPKVLGMSAFFFAELGRTEAAVANAQRSVVLDPLNNNTYRNLGWVLYYARRERDAIEAYNQALSINPQAFQVAVARGYAHLSLGEFEAARESCATPPIDLLSTVCLAIVYHKLNRQSDADAALAKLRADTGEDSAFQYAQIYGQWGDVPKALEWLETAYRMHDPGLLDLKAHPLVDPLRQEPRFREIERKLKFPN